MEDNNPHFKVTRNEFQSDIRRPDGFLARFDRGKGISMAREAGYELVDQARMVTLLTDLQNENLLSDDEDGNIPNLEEVATRAMEILRG